MNVLFIAYHPVSYPVMLSQGLPYMSGLSKNGVRYSLLTFETDKSKTCSGRYISEFGAPVKWRYLTYHNRPRIAATIFDVTLGILTVTYMILRDKIKIIHARGFIPALIALIPAKLFRVRLFFDTRGLLADKYVCGGLLNKNGLSYKIMRYCEDLLLKHSDIFTVETDSHAEVVKKTQSYLTPKMRMIPCCVDMSKFDYRLYEYSREDEFRLVYSGQIGTWYLLDKMLDFFKIALQEFSRAHFTFISENDPAVFYSAAKRIGIDENKIIVRKADSKDIPNLLAAANVGVFFMNPYRRYNTFPIKFGEYLASGLPVVVNSGIGDCDKMIRKENVGAIVKDFSAGEYKISVGILRLLLKEGEALKKRCRLAAEECCSLEKGIEGYWSIYKDLAG
ncbi:MAG: glycosyltransferase [Candidatus Omnitrophica bacterium]|nr:glycosyltransferase [Candidatus Omnitrophota bacterium]